MGFGTSSRLSRIINGEAWALDDRAELPLAAVRWAPISSVVVVMRLPCVWIDISGASLADGLPLRQSRRSGVTRSETAAPRTQQAWELRV